MGPPSGSTDSAYVELYVRSLSPRESRRRIESIIGRLDALVEANVLSGYRVHVTGTELPATAESAITSYGSYLLNRVDAFHDWASATGRSLRSIFERRTVYSRFTDEEHDVLVPPTVLMAEYDDADVRFVAPCHEDDDHVTVWDRLETLTTGGDEGPDGYRLDRDGRSRRAGSTPQTESPHPGS